MNLKERADFIRSEVVRVAVANGAGHIAPSLSCVDILTVLYYQIMKINNDPLWEDRDRLILSKSHGCYGQYAILSDLGYIPKEYWDDFYISGPLSGCAERCSKYGLEAGCGSLGHGLPMAVGLAFGAKLHKKDYKIFCVIGDGEMQEGSNWEAVQFAAKHQLTNLIIIVDANKLQAMDFLDEVMTPKGKGIENDLWEKFSAFGFLVDDCDGHNIDEMVFCLKPMMNYVGPAELEKPKVLLASTKKGYGLRCMENIPKFHFRLPTQEELKEGNRYE